ncbi:MAG TPA: nucleotidyl transferase AbiEii/AbiGii toxin family protein [Candidatus Obscuribacterales bacterium]
MEQLRSEVAFERALARFDYKKWVLKGGYAVRLMLPVSRATQDLDLVLQEQSLKDLEPQKRALRIQQAVEAELSKDARDHFHFEVRQAIPIGDLEPENLAAIVLINAKIGGEEFCKIRIDVGVTDQERLPGEHVAGRDLLAFAGVENPDIVTTAKEEIFADKLLAYAGQGENGMRWRDLVDMQLLIAKGLDDKKLFMAMQAVEEREEHSYPTELQFPPRHWAKEYGETASKCQLPTGLEEAFAHLKEFAHPVLERFREHRS